MGLQTEKETEIMNATEQPIPIICVACPKGCRLEVLREEGEILVEHAGCKRGREYALAEISDPRRMLASTVRISGALHPLLPVATAAPFPKGHLRDLLAALRQVQVRAPVRVGQVILPDALGSGIDILASRDMGL